MFTVLNLTLAVFATYFAYPSVYDFYAEKLQDELTIQVAAIISAFVLAWVIFAIISSFILDTLGNMKGKGLDRLMGIAFGLLRGALLVSGVYIGTAMMHGAFDDDEKLPEWLQNAQTLSLAKMTSEYVVDFMPESAEEFIKNDDQDFMERMIDGLRRREEIPDEEQELLDLGFTRENLRTIEDISEDLSDSNYTSTLSLREISELGRDSIKYYGEGLMEDYMEALRRGHVEPDISASRLSSLEDAFKEL